MRAEEISSKIKGLAESACKRQDGEIAKALIPSSEEAKLRIILRGFTASVILLTTTLPEIIQPLLLKFLSDQLGDMENLLPSFPEKKGLAGKMAAMRRLGQYKEMERAGLSPEEAMSMSEANGFMMRVVIAMIDDLSGPSVPLFLKLGREELSDMGKVFCLDSQ